MVESKIPIAMFVDSSQAIPTSLKNYPSSIEHPSEVDCLCGKDTTFGRHPGNRMFRQKVLALLPLFMAARTKAEKMKVTRSIVDYMKRKGSRFLKIKANGSWVEIDTQATRDKVSHALRFAARQHKKQQEDTQSFLSCASDKQQDDLKDSLNPLPLSTKKESSTTSVRSFETMNEQVLPTNVDTDKVSSFKFFGSFYPIDGIQPLKHEDLPRCESGGFCMPSTRVPLLQDEFVDPFAVIDNDKTQLSTDDIACLVAL